MSYANAPLNSKIERVTLISFDGRNSLDINSLVSEINLYESIFYGFIRADITILDATDLIHNFPLSGEEFIEIEIIPNRDGDEIAKRIDYIRYFVIESIEQFVIDDNGRKLAFKINLLSRLAYENEKVMVSHAYNNTTAEVAIKIFYEYLVQPILTVPYKKANLNFARNIGNIVENDIPNREAIITAIQGIIPSEFLQLTSQFFASDIWFGSDQTDDKRIWVIPNMKPIDAIMWLSKFAVSSENGKIFNNYFFFETMNGFYYTSLQKLIKIKKRLIENEEPYTYRSNIVTAEGDIYDVQRQRTILDMEYESRYKTLDKISLGYFENNYIDINVLEKQLSTINDLLENYTRLQDGSQRELLGTHITNTDLYKNSALSENTLAASQINKETVNRTRYRFNGFSSVSDKRYEFKMKDNWGEKVRNSSVMDEITLNISVPGDIYLNAGDVIPCKLPKITGYDLNQDPEEDEFLTGNFLISDVKHTFFNGYHITTLKLNKDSYELNINEREFRYKLNENA